MNKKLVFYVILSMAVSLLILVLFNQRTDSVNKELAVSSIEDGTGVFVGERRPQYKESDPSKWSAETRAEVETYEASVKAINDSWEYRRKADLFFKNQQHVEAVAAYKKAYEISTNKVLYGTVLVEVYEQLGRYDEALALLNDIESKVDLAEIGKQRFNDMRARLLAAK